MLFEQKSSLIQECQRFVDVMCGWSLVAPVLAIEHRPVKPCHHAPDLMGGDSTYDVLGWSRERGSQKAVYLCSKLAKLCQLSS